MAVGVVDVVGVEELANVAEVVETAGVVEVGRSVGRRWTGGGRAVDGRYLHPRVGNIRYALGGLMVQVLSASRVPCATGNQEWWYR